MPNKPDDEFILLLDCLVEHGKFRALKEEMIWGHLVWVLQMWPYPNDCRWTLI